MTTINKLASVDSIEDGDMFPLFSNANMDARKASASLLKTYIAGPIKDETKAEIFAELAESDGAALVGWAQTATGAAPRTVDAKLREIVSVKDFGTSSEAFAHALAAKKLLINTDTGQLFGTTDSLPLNYDGTRAGLVWQHRDSGPAAANALVPGIVFQFHFTGDGSVNSGIELSTSIWQGQYNYVKKTGDGSAHAFTGIGELGAVGGGGYNELGMYQGEMTNTGSALGTMSGVEMLLKDSPDGGTTTHSTKMQGIVSRLAKYNPTTRRSYNFFASCEGTRAVNGIIGVNHSGLHEWQYGIDFEGATFTTGNWALAPNNTAIAWMDSSGAAVSAIGVSNTNVLYLKAVTEAATVDLKDYSGVTRFQVTGDGNVDFQNSTLTATANTGTNGATPSQVAFYLSVRVNGSSVRIPCYNP